MAFNLSITGYRFETQVLNVTARSVNEFQFQLYTTIYLCKLVKRGEWLSFHKLKIEASDLTKTKQAVRM
jgi:hypothetical protein